jgi:hypothetical protein
MRTLRYAWHAFWFRWWSWRLARIRKWELIARVTAECQRANHEEAMKDLEAL